MFVKKKWKILFVALYIGFVYFIATTIFDSVDDTQIFQILRMYSPTREPNEIDNDIWRPSGKEVLAKIEAPAFKTGYFMKEYVFDNAPFLHERVKDWKIRFNSTPIKPGTIFVLIASFRDKDCNETLNQIFTKCENCDRVYVGLCEQINLVEKDGEPNSNFTCFGTLHRKNVRVIHLEGFRSRGPTYARYIASKLWDGEEYVLEIDSHSQFTKNWDTKIIHDYHNIPFPTGTNISKWINKQRPMHLFSGYPVVWDTNLELYERTATPIICNANWTHSGANKSMYQQMALAWHDTQKEGGTPFPIFQLGAGFIFGSSNMLYDGPFDPNTPMLFHGEEQYYMMHLWTRGWRFFSPPRNYVAHRYGLHPHMIWDEKTVHGPWWEQQTASGDRIEYLLGYTDVKPSKSPYNESLEDFQMGTVRSVKDWEEFADIHPKERRQGNRCNQKYDYVNDKWVDR